MKAGVSIKTKSTDEINSSGSFSQVPVVLDSHFRH